MYTVVYDGNCNLCVTLVRLLEQLDQGQQFAYVPMQDAAQLAQWDISPDDCEQGMLLIDGSNPDVRWQGSDAAERIGQLLPAGNGFVQLYRSLPGLKSAGDRLYTYVRDHRYALFGKRKHTYTSSYAVGGTEPCSSCQYPSR